jgi:hypothetical protein
MKVSRLMLALAVCVVCAKVAAADVTVTTPYPYDRVPKAGVEAGTYAFTVSGYEGTDCFSTYTGAVKFLPNSAGTGGSLCAKGNIQFVGAGPVCVSEIASGANKQLFVLSGPYYNNHDGTLCENVTIVGGAFNGQPLTFHDYVSRDGKQILISNQNIDYACPGVAQPQTGLVAGPGSLFKISEVADDPPGSGKLDCTNP